MCGQKLNAFEAMQELMAGGEVYTNDVVYSMECGVVHGRYIGKHGKFKTSISCCDTSVRAFEKYVKPRVQLDPKTAKSGQEIQCDGGATKHFFIGLIRTRLRNDHCDFAWQDNTSGAVHPGNSSLWHLAD